MLCAGILCHAVSLLDDASETVAADVLYASTCALAVTMDGLDDSSNDEVSIDVAVPWSHQRRTSSHRSSLHPHP